MPTDYKTVLLAVVSFIAGGIVTRLMPGPATSNLIMDDVKFVNRSIHDPPLMSRSNETYHTLPPIPQHNAQQNYPTSTPIIKELIPPELYKYQYTPDKLRFNVSRSMLRRSRPIIGNNERLHAYIKKLHSKQCTTVLFLGGSVTDGHNVRGGSHNAYPQHFLFWLNAKYPCLNADGSKGRHQIKKTHAQNSQTHFIHWSTVSQLERIDLVFLEFNIVSASKFRFDIKLTVVHISTSF